ncbi:MAG TPA: ABC transporter substrate-binding protein/permease [Pyrinomonadaceae bacterium]
MHRKTFKAAVTLSILIICALPIHAQQTLRWGADPSGGAPYVYTDPANPENYIGYEKEMVDALAQAMGRRAEFVPSDWETLVSALQRNSFDVIVNGLEPTGDRAQQIAFSNPYYVFQLQLTVRRDDDRIHSIDDCKKRIVGTLGNTAASRILQQQGIPFRSYQDPVGAYRDLELKRIDAVVMDVPAEAFYARDNPKLKQAGSPFSRGTYVIGLRKGDDALKADVDKAIEKIITDGTLERILTKWKLWNDAQVEFQNSVKTKTAPTVPFEMTNSSFNWGEALMRLTRAALVTVSLALGSMIIAVTLGLPLAVGQWNGPRWLKVICTVYVEFFRGTPVLVQLLFLYFGLPMVTGIGMPGWLTALVGLGLNYAAYESQVYRAALEAIPKGQWEASYSLGMSPLLAFRRIILPQAFRIALPPMTNDFVSLFKDTSVAFAISVWELATAYRELANASGQFLLLGVIVSLFYLAMSLPMARLAGMLEKRLSNRSIERVDEAEVTA